MELIIIIFLFHFSSTMGGGDSIPFIKFDPTPQSIETWRTDNSLYHVLQNMLIWKLSGKK